MDAPVRFKSPKAEPPPRPTDPPEPGIRAVMAEAVSFKAKQRAARMARIEKLIRERLPLSVIHERVGGDINIIARVARELGIRLPTYAEWDA